MSDLSSSPNVSSESEPDPNTDLECNMKFHTPVYLQRYDKVYNILNDPIWKDDLHKLTDFGCSEFGLFVYIKRNSSLNEILFVDIDEDTLQEYRYRLHPLAAEYLNKRQAPLKVQVYAGSVTDPDYRLQNTDVVTAVELIEHLYPDTLNEFPFNIFGYIAPKVAIITTPNADFNVLFSGNPNRFRHYDHKFEWTRSQFEDWANNIILRYPDYDVTFHGIGDGPDGTEHLGMCSQMAVFFKKCILEKTTGENCDCGSPNFDELCKPRETYYKQIDYIEYPFEIESRSKEQIIVDELHYRICNIGGTLREFVNDERNVSEIPIRRLMYGDKIGSIDESELSNILIKHNYILEKCIVNETGLMETCVIYELEENSSSSDEFDCEYVGPQYIQDEDDNISDWDDLGEPELDHTFAARLVVTTSEDCHR